MAGWPTKIEGTTVPISALPAPGEYLAYTLREPVGVVGQIIPWNFPLLMAAWKLGPVLACGCTVVLKPAEQTPLSALRLGELLQEAGLPDGVVNIVTGFGDAGAALAAHDDVDKVAFTGSTEVGKLIVKAAAGNLKKVTLELGGKSPNVVFADADLEGAIAGAANGIFFNHGQCCNAGSRLYVQKRDLRRRRRRRRRGGQEASRSAPGTDPDAADGAADLRRAVREGPRLSGLGRAATAPRRSSAAAAPATAATSCSRRSSPTPTRHEGRARGDLRPGRVRDPVRLDPTRSSRSPTTPTTASPPGVFTRDISKAHRTAKRLRAGTVWINTYHVFDAAMPFGGYKESGWGREMGSQVLNNYLETKSVVDGPLRLLRSRYAGKRCVSPRRPRGDTTLRRGLHWQRPPVVP